MCYKIGEEEDHEMLLVQCQFTYIISDVNSFFNINFNPWFFFNFFYFFSLNSFVYFVVLILIITEVNLVHNLI